jgi:hypothetical protein
VLRRRLRSAHLVPDVKAIGSEDSSEEWKVKGLEGVSRERVCVGLSSFQVGWKERDCVIVQSEACSPEKREEWMANRWLHHGAVGELLVIRESRKRKSFLVGLGKGLMNSDLQDSNEWHTAEYSRAREMLERMR